MHLGPQHFAPFFEAIHGHRPFPWQERLLTELAASDTWPDVLDLPTGTGKTAALDIAIFHLALRHDEPDRTAVRIALVVDRRLVVDAAYERATKIEKALLPDRRGAHPVLEEVAHRLQRLAGDDELPLVAARLRGGAPLENVWTRTPTQPTILCSTVDQVGSRLLFRGYGVSDRMKPIHAGLLGEGSLILLDEAHLSEPFRQTLDAVRCIGGAGVKTVLLTATPGIEAARRFQLSEADRENTDLAKRIQTPKPTRLVPVKKTMPPERVFADEATAMMERLKNTSLDSPAVGVVVNRVALARSIFDALQEDILRDDSECEAVLMIGRARGVDRDRLAAKLQPFFTGETARTEAKPTFIVATQCLEVGVDLDLDGLVTQAASLDALRQRFGRLNRAGRSIQAEGRILALAADVAKKAEDPVYGDRLRKTWEALTLDERSELDFGSENLPAALDRDADALSARRPDAPVVMPAYLDLWAQTAPIPACDPEVGLFLHGVEKAEADVSVVWRDDLLEDDLAPSPDTKKGKEMARRIAARLTLLPPRAAEMIQIPVAAARRWLRATAESVAETPELADAPQRSEAEEMPVSRWRQPARPAFRWAGQGHARTGFIREPRDLRPGDLIVVPAAYGGCDEFGWTPDRTEPVADVADRAARPYLGRRYAVRLRECRFGENRALWRRIATTLAQTDDLSDEDLLDHLLVAFEPDASDSGDAPSSNLVADIRRGIEALKHARGKLQSFPYGGNPRDGVVLVAPRGLQGSAPRAGMAPTTEEDSFSQGVGRPVSLDDHGRHVAEQAQTFASALRLDDRTTSDLRLAAWLHDAGKADPRFQTFLSGAGNPWNAPDDTDQVLAKSGRASARGAWERAGLPDGWRHEALSVQLARAHPKFASAHDPALVLWLIGTHHGLGRPFFGHADPSPPPPRPALDLTANDLDLEEPGPHSPAFDFDGSDWPALAEDLRGRYGVWRLAFFEALIRLADHRASEREADERQEEAAE